MSGKLGNDSVIYFNLLDLDRVVILCIEHRRNVDATSERLIDVVCLLGTYSVMDREVT